MPENFLFISLTIIIIVAVRAGSVLQRVLVRRMVFVFPPLMWKILMVSSLVLGFALGFYLARSKSSYRGLMLCVNRMRRFNSTMFFSYVIRGS